MRKKKVEKESVQILDKLNQQNLLLNKLINRLVREENQKTIEIGKINLQIDSVKTEVKRLKEEYAKYVVWIYKQGQNSTLKYLLNADSFNQVVVRYKYLNYITSKNEKVLDNLKNKKELLVQLNSRKQEELRQKEILVDQKTQEQTLLASKKIEKQSMISSLKKDQKSIENEIIEKQKAEIQIKNLISRLIEEERRREARLREARLRNESTAGMYNYNYDNFENFTSLRGNLGWPVQEGSVVRKFGENKNEKLNTVTLNYGIDIQTKDKNDVLAVAEGIISAIDWIPGYGSVVIITHKDEFRTVYGHLTDITLQEGDHVAGGSKIGTVNESLEGMIIHFEIWNERNYQNPEVWLAKK